MLKEAFMAFSESQTETLTAYPNGWTVIEGAPTIKNLKFYQDDAQKRFSGIWECTTGKFTVDYSVWEYCHLIKGQCVITHEDGRTYTLNAGDSFILEPGFKGTWQVVEDVQKHYVILA